MVALLILLLLSSCMMTEIINEPLPYADTTYVKSRKETARDTAMVQVDTTVEEIMVPIEFDPSVEDWDEHEDINI